jgi:hypothetical protein
LENAVSTDDPATIGIVDGPVERVGQRPEALNPASLGPDLLALALPPGWQLGGLQWQPSEPSDPELVTLQVTLSGRGGEQRKGLVHFDRSLPDGLIRTLHLEGA